MFAAFVELFPLFVFFFLFLSCNHDTSLYWLLILSRRNENTLLAFLNFSKMSSDKEHSISFHFFCKVYVSVPSYITQFSFSIDYLMLLVIFLQTTAHVTM